MTLRSTRRLARRDEMSGTAGAIRGRVVIGADWSCADRAMASLDECLRERPPTGHETGAERDDEIGEMHERRCELRGPERQVADDAHAVERGRDHGHGPQEDR